MEIKTEKQEEITIKFCKERFFKNIPVIRDTTYDGELKWADDKRL
jgi:hypothetical protein